MLAARAVAAWNLQDFRTTATDATLVLKAHPDMQAMWTARAAAYNELGRRAEALQDAEKAVALAPRSGRPYLERALAKESLHDSTANVLADFKQAAELDPQFTPDYEQALARLMSQAPGQGAAQNIPSRALNSRSAPWAAAGLLALAGLAAAGFVLMRRS